MQALAADDLAECVGGDVSDVTLAAVDRVGLPLVNLEARGVEAAARELDSQRQTDVAKADDAYARPLSVHEIYDFLFDHECVRVSVQKVCGGFDA